VNCAAGNYRGASQQTERNSGVGPRPSLPFISSLSPLPPPPPLPLPSPSLPPLLFHSPLFHPQFFRRLFDETCGRNGRTTDVLRELAVEILPSALAQQTMLPSRRQFMRSQVAANSERVSEDNLRKYCIPISSRVEAARAKEAGAGKLIGGASDFPG